MPQDCQINILVSMKFASLLSSLLLEMLMAMEPSKGGHAEREDFSEIGIASGQSKGSVLLVNSRGFPKKKKKLG